MLEEATPARFVLFGALADAKNLSISFAVHPDRHQQRDVADLAGPAALEYDAVEVHIRMLTFDRPVAPCLDRSVNLLVQVRYRRRRHARAPQGFGDVLNPPHRDPGQIHLDQSFLDRVLAPPVTLNNGRLECLRPKLRNPQLNLSGLGLQLALVMAGPGIAACLAALVTLRIAYRSASASSSAFNVSSTLPRTT